MALPKLKIKTSRYVMCADEMDLIGEFHYMNPTVARKKAEKKANEHAVKTKHCAIVLKPESYH